MGFLNDATSGYQKLKNTRGLTNEMILAELQNIALSFGTPELDTVGKKKAVVIHHVGRFDVYASADEKNIEIARVIGKDQSIGKNLLKELAVASVSNAQAKDTAEADRAVDELTDLIKQYLENGAMFTRVVNAYTGASTKFYMRQKVLSIKDKYSICTADETPVYWVAGNLLGLSFNVQTADGNDIFTIKKKMVSITPEYTLLEGKKEIGHIKKKIRLTRPEISGEINGEELTIKGDMSGYHFSISLNGMVVGNVDTERLTWGDCYSIEVLDESKKDLIVAVAVICDNTLKNKQ